MEENEKPSDKPRSIALIEMVTAKWTTQEWLHFLKSLPLPEEKAGATAAVLDRQQRKHRLHGSRRRQRMADHRLVR